MDLCGEWARTKVYINIEEVDVREELQVNLLGTLWLCFAENQKGHLTHVRSMKISSMNQNQVKHFSREEFKWCCSSCSKNRLTYVGSIKKPIVVPLM